jgi:hypothetical protein
MMTDRERIRIAAQELMVSTRVIEQLANSPLLGQGRSVADLIGLGASAGKETSRPAAQPSGRGWRIWRRTRR